MSNLSRACQEVIEVSEKATPSPWFWSKDLGSLMTPEEVCPILSFLLTEQNIIPETEDANCIAITRNHADKLARACLVMEEALRKVQRGSKDRFQSAKEALAQVEYIFK